MSKRIVLLALIVSTVIVLVAVIPVTAEAITHTETLHNETMVFPDVSICDEIPAIVTLNFNGVMHVTEYTGDHPNAGSAHARFNMNFNVVVNDADTGELLETAHGVKTIYHDNINRQNATSNFNFVSVGSGPVGRHQYQFNGHVNLDANGDPIEVTHLNVHCW